MYDPQRFYLLLYVALAATTIPVSSGFNIDTANPTVHSGDPEDFFGYKVLQYMSSRNKGIIVTAPLRLNGSGGIFKHDQDETEKWFSPNGFNVSRADKLTNEMSQSGFSAVSHKDTLILGLVGSNSWRGALNEPQKQDKKILDPNMQDDSYMGYSLSVGERNGKPLYFTGAPRFNHMGQVIVFQPDDDDWKPVQRITEDQVGSYFGAELCSVDIDSDGNTDFLLVGAPQFYLAEEKKEGMIYVYSLSDEMKLKKVFQVRAPSMGRFGTTISSLSDLNGDGLRDVAVGAPLEEDNTGAVYIYLGHGGVGIRNISSQRITGADFSPRLRFFGQAINGDIDLGDDRLPDIVVGSKGSAVVLRSKSVLNVKTSLSFYPNVISIQEINCLEENEILPMVTVQACFEMAEATNSTAEKRINISVMLNTDSTRSMYRGFFIENKEKSRNTTHTYELTGRETCFNYSIYMNKCVKHTLSPVHIHLNFSQPNAENASAILNVDSKRWAVVEVPFEKRCAKKEICIADLKVDFNLTNGEVLVTENTVFSVLIRLDNIGDDSYNTSLTMHYPPGLSFSIMELTGTKKLTYICTGLEDVPDKTVCGISLPVYHSKSSATFNATFRVARDFEWNETLSMSVSAQSENSNSSEPVSVTKASPVKYAVKLAIAVNDATVTHLDFTPEKHEPKRMAIIYDINNTGFKDFPIMVSLFFPSKLEHNFELKNYKVIVEQNKTRCLFISILKPEDCPLKENCIAMKCDSFTLKNYSGVQFTLEGVVGFRNLQHHASNMPFLKQYTGNIGEFNFTSFIKVDYDDGKYVMASNKYQKNNQNGNGKVKKSVNVLVEFLVPPNRLLIISTVVVLGIMLLVIIPWKTGFFKRKNIQHYQEQEDELSTVVQLVAFKRFHF